MPQPPQFSGSVVVSGGVETQAPSTHAVPVHGSLSSQAMPQPPQLATSLLKAGAITSPWAWCSFTACGSTSMKVSGWLREPVRWQTPTLSEDECAGLDELV